MDFHDDDFLDIPDCLPRSNSISGSSISRKSSIRSSTTTTSSTTDRYTNLPTSGLSDISVRGLFEEIKSLKKENLDLKLKIYFLEDSNSQSNKIKELMDYNVKLKIEVDDSNAEVERKKQLIEETISILDVQQTKLDEYEKKITFLEQSCEEMKIEILESQEKEFESRGSTPTPSQVKHSPPPIVDQENFNFTRFEDKMQESAFSCNIF